MTQVTDIPDAKPVFLEEPMDGVGAGAGVTQSGSDLVVLSGTEIAPGTVVVPAENVIAAAAAATTAAAEERRASSGMYPLQVDVVPLGPGESRKLGHKCFGGCCDMRRAVIIVNSISLVLSLLVLSTYAAATAEYFDDDYYSSVEYKNFLRTITFILTALEIFFCCLGILGAARFAWCLVALTGVWHGVTFILAFWSFSIVVMVIAALYVYPHIVLVREIKRGIMSRDTYERREKFSCCCK